MPPYNDSSDRSTMIFEHTFLHEHVCVYVQVVMLMVDAVLRLSGASKNSALNFSGKFCFACLQASDLNLIGLRRNLHPYLDPRCPRGL